MDIGFIGLGRMGSAMARNLAGAPHAVTGFDSAGTTVDGVQVASSPAEAAEGRDVIITMLPNATAVREVREQCFATARRNALFIDCSTLDVASAVALAGEAEAAGHMAIDAPVSGGQVGAEAGTLAFMVGASDEVYAEVLPLLEVMGARIVHCGAAGLGQAAKICNNMVLGISQIAVAEAFVLGERLGLQHQALYDVMSKASGQCWSLTTNCPVPGPVPGSPANRDFQPGFAGALMAKDLGLALAALDEQGVAADLGRLAQAKYAEYAAGEGAARDFSGIIEDIRASHTDRSEA